MMYIGLHSDNKIDKKINVSKIANDRSTVPQRGVAVG